MKKHERRKKSSLWLLPPPETLSTTTKLSSFQKDTTAKTLLIDMQLLFFLIKAKKALRFSPKVSWGFKANKALWFVGALSTNRTWALIGKGAKGGKIHIYV